MWPTLSLLFWLLPSSALANQLLLGDVKHYRSHYQRDSTGVLPQKPDLKLWYTVKYRERDLPGVHKFNQHFVNLFGKGLDVKDVHEYAKAPLPNFNGSFIRQCEAVVSCREILGNITAVKFCTDLQNDITKKVEE